MAVLEVPSAPPRTGGTNKTRHSKVVIAVNSFQLPNERDKQLVKLGVGSLQKWELARQPPQSVYRRRAPAKHTHMFLVQKLLSS